jgi:hypothetical protein
MEQALEHNCYQLTPNDISEHFRRLENSPISDCDPRLIINFDETGFGASKSGRSKSAKVLVPMSFKGKPVHEELSESHFVSALGAMTLAGDVLSPALITKRTASHSFSSRRTAAT